MKNVWVSVCTLVITGLVLQTGGKRVEIVTQLHTAIDEDGAVALAGESEKGIETPGSMMDTTMALMDEQPYNIPEQITNTQFDELAIKWGCKLAKVPDGKKPPCTNQTCYAEAASAYMKMMAKKEACDQLMRPREPCGKALEGKWRGTEWWGPFKAFGEISWTDVKGYGGVMKTETKNSGWGATLAREFGALIHLTKMEHVGFKAEEIKIPPKDFISDDWGFRVASAKVTKMSSTNDAQNSDPICIVERHDKLQNDKIWGLVYAADILSGADAYEAQQKGDTGNKGEIDVKVHKVGELESSTRVLKIQWFHSKMSWSGGDGLDVVDGEWTKVLEPLGVMPLTEEGRRIRSIRLMIAKFAGTIDIIQSGWLHTGSSRPVLKWLEDFTRYCTVTCPLKWVKVFYYTLKISYETNKLMQMAQRQMGSLLGSTSKVTQAQVLNELDTTAGTTKKVGSMVKENLWKFMSFMVETIDNSIFLRAQIFMHHGIKLMMIGWILKIFGLDDLTFSCRFKKILEMKENSAEKYKRKNPNFWLAFTAWCPDWMKGLDLSTALHQMTYASLQWVSKNTEVITSKVENSKFAAKTKRLIHKMVHKIANAVQSAAGPVLTGLLATVDEVALNRLAKMGVIDEEEKKMMQQSSSPPPYPLGQTAACVSYFSTDWLQHGSQGVWGFQQVIPNGFVYNMPSGEDGEMRVRSAVLSEGVVEMRRSNYCKELTIGSDLKRIANKVLGPAHTIRVLAVDSVSDIIDIGTDTISQRKNIRSSALKALKTCKGKEVHLNIGKATGLARTHNDKLPDPYIKVIAGGNVIYQTKVVQKSLDPEWNETTKFFVAADVQKVDLLLFDGGKYTAWERGWKGLETWHAPMGRVVVDLKGGKQELVVGNNKCNRVELAILSGKKLGSTLWSNPYVEVVVKGKVLRTTEVKRMSWNPEWNEKFRFLLLEETKEVELTVFNSNSLKPFSKGTCMGRAVVSLSEPGDNFKEKSFTLEGGKDCDLGWFTGTLNVGLKVTSESCPADLKLPTGQVFVESLESVPESSLVDQSMVAEVAVHGHQSDQTSDASFIETTSSCADLATKWLNMPEAGIFRDGYQFCILLLSYNDRGSLHHVLCSQDKSEVEGWKSAIQLHHQTYQGKLHSDMGEFAEALEEEMQEISATVDEVTGRAALQDSDTNVNEHLVKIQDESMKSVTAKYNMSGALLELSDDLSRDRTALEAQIAASNSAVDAAVAKFRVGFDLVKRDAPNIGDSIGIFQTVFLEAHEHVQFLRQHDATQLDAFKCKYKEDFVSMHNPGDCVRSEDYKVAVHGSKWVDCNGIWDCDQALINKEFSSECLTATSVFLELCSVDGLTEKGETLILSEGCFPSNTLVEVGTLSSSGTIHQTSVQPISDIRVGAFVRTADGFERVFAVTTSRPDMDHVFLRLVISTSDQKANAAVELTRNHLIPVQGKLVRADAVRVGDPLHLADGRLGTVISVDKIISQGYHNVKTPSGLLAVQAHDSSQAIVASTRVDYGLPNWIQAGAWLEAPLLLVSYVFPWWVDVGGPLGEAVSAWEEFYRFSTSACELPFTGPWNWCNDAVMKHLVSAFGQFASI
eukprot:gnl/MRDRNA2_/MRDRNA2_72507_c0_seq1.p1 gnl/MRDRNA2_/MRDRNA2_72507_c0~~gnl/MRDRNA2_/MRDRNA2_72507_c0_seq1.p1  ORF type:complete len:1584 (+),score=321.52 gnl/MRDRNA2_/MRDRNA2_72507_c0_seq1:115-4866(+)